MLTEPLDDIRLLLFAATAALINLLGGRDGNLHPSVDFSLLLRRGLGADIGDDEGGDKGCDKSRNRLNDGSDVVHSSSSL